MDSSNAPEIVGDYNLDWDEYMNYQYLPVQIRDHRDNVHYSIPDNLLFADDMIADCTVEEGTRGNRWRYVYVTAKRSFASPGNALNRAGWHADGFGTPDINYVWTDKYPTVFAVGDFTMGGVLPPISDDHIESVKQMEKAIELNRKVGFGHILMETFADKTLLRLDSTMIHAAPEIPAPGSIRSFFKVSFSNDKYNLKGNAHNYGLSYDWEMHARETVRNDPARAGKDSA
jgi:hypothetical protein